MVKHFRKNGAGAKNKDVLFQDKEKIPTIDDLDDEQKEMLKHLSNYRKRTGKQTPTYEEMLGLNEDEFKTWMIIRTQKENREAFLEEIIEYGEKTGSTSKALKETDTPQGKLIVDVFNKEKSKEVVRVLENLFKVANKYGYKAKDGDNGDIIRDAIYVKSVSDYCKLGEKV